MRTGKILIAIGLSGVLLALSAGEASARWYHRPYVYHRGGPGLIGGLLIGAATIATLPFAILGSAVAPRRDYYGPPGPDYGPPAYGPPAYGPPPEAYAPPPPPRPYYYGPRGYYGPPPGYYGY